MTTNFRIKLLDGLSRIGLDALDFLSVRVAIYLLSLVAFTEGTVGRTVKESSLRELP